MDVDKQNKKMNYLTISVAYMKSLGWGKEDVKKVIVFIGFLFFAVFYINEYLVIKVNIRQDRHDSFEISGSVDAAVIEPLGGFDVTIRQ